MIHVREAKQKETDAIAAVLAPAFQDKVMVIVGDMERALDIIPTVIEAMDGKVYVAEDVDEPGKLLGSIIITTKEPKFLLSSLGVCLRKMGVLGTLRAFRMILDYDKSLPRKLEKEGVLEAVGVAEGQRGRQIGELLVLKGEEYLRNLGYLHFGLGVKQESPAVRFYQRLDFKETGSYGNRLGKWFYMRKSLA